jgi:hypothetical protein
METFPSAESAEQFEKPSFPQEVEDILFSRDEEIAQVLAAGMDFVCPLEVDGKKMTLTVTPDNSISLEEVTE